MTVKRKQVAARVRDKKTDDTSPLALVQAVTASSDGDQSGSDTDPVTEGKVAKQRVHSPVVDGSAENKDAELTEKTSCKAIDLGAANGATLKSERALESAAVKVESSEGGVDVEVRTASSLTRPAAKAKEPSGGDDPGDEKPTSSEDASDDAVDRPGSNSTLVLDIENLSDALVERIMAMRKECNLSSGTFYVTKLPMDLSFGRQDAFDMRNFLVRAKNYAVKIYVCGRVSALLFFDGDGRPVNRPFLSIRPLSEEDSAAAAEIINNYSLPVQHTTKHSYRTIIAGRWQQMWGSAPGAPAQRFNAVYLATSGIRERTRYETAKLKRNDLVVVELRVRKRADTENRDHYTATFQLQAVNVLEVSAEEAVEGDVEAVVDW